jgi:hypothetical protein
MADHIVPIRDKVLTMFRELAGERAETLNALRLPADITSTITAALTNSESDVTEILQADEIAFHLTDWNADAAFLVALHLFPERFTAEEIREGVQNFLIHVPHHVIAAARLGGHSVEDIFKQDNP